MSFCPVTIRQGYFQVTKWQSLCNLLYIYSEKHVFRINI